MAKETFKPGQNAPHTGEAELLDAKGKAVGVTRAVTAGKPFPPTKAKGQVWSLVEGKPAKK